jgi:hypothetical protein
MRDRFIIVGMYLFNRWLTFFPFHAPRLWLLRRMLGRIGKEPSVLMGLEVRDPANINLGDHVVINRSVLHTSTPGMELPLEGVPCVVVSRTHYRGKGFTIDITSKDEYFRLLAEWKDSPIPREQMRTLALRYAWLLFEQYHLPLDFLLEADFGRYWALNVGQDEQLGKNPVMKFLCDCVEQQSDFLAAD